MRVLVTGATGFFGPEIVAGLRAAGHQVFGASRRMRNGEESRTLDVTSLASCTETFESFAPLDAVVHAAALAHVKPGEDTAEVCHKVNVVGTENVLAAAAATGVRRLVYVSSVMVYGDFDLPSVVQEGDACAASGVYGVAKMRAEAACRAREDVLDVHILRMATMYSADWLFNVRKRACINVAGTPVYFRLHSGTRRYSLCSRRNGAAAVLWAVEGRMPPGVYNVADQYVYCQQEILSAVRAVAGPGWQLSVPSVLPRLLEYAVRRAVPIERWRTNARSRYWKFCEHNVYSADKLARHGFRATPDLLWISSAPAPAQHSRQR